MDAKHVLVVKSGCKSYQHVFACEVYLYAIDHYGRIKIKIPWFEFRALEGFSDWHVKLIVLWIDSIIVNICISETMGKALITVYLNISMYTHGHNNGK